MQNLSFCDWFFSLTVVFSRSVHVVPGVLSFFMRLNTIPLCIQTTFCMLFHLGCFHIAAVVSNVGLNMGVQPLFKTLLSVLLGSYPNIKFQDYMIILFLIFGGIALLFPQQLYLFTFLKQCARVPVFPYLFQCLFSVFFFFESSHLNGREIFIFQSVTLTYLYLINVILGPIPAVLFYVFNVLCLFPDSLHPFPIFCWVD